jgi:hypothetical protein
MSGPKPTIQSVVICDTIIQDVATKKNTLVGVFTKINPISYPTSLASMGIYIAATSVPKTGKITMVFRHEDHMDSFQLTDLEYSSENEDRRELIQLAAQFHGIPIKRPGRYEIVILWDNDQVHTQSLEAMPAQGAKNG